MDLNVSGLASGFDWKSMVDQLTHIERAPQQRMRIEQADIRRKNSAFTAVKTQLSALKTKSEELKKRIDRILLLKLIFPRHTKTTKIYLLIFSSKKLLAAAFIYCCLLFLTSPRLRLLVCYSCLHNSLKTNGFITDVSYKPEILAAILELLRLFLTLIHTLV